MSTGKHYNVNRESLCYNISCPRNLQKKTSKWLSENWTALCAINVGKQKTILTPKFHIIESHLKFYFQRTGKSLGFYTDQVVEAMHQFTDRRLTRSNYVVKDIQSDIHGEKLLD